MFLYVIVVFGYFAICTDTHQIDNSTYDMVYWDLKPYIFLNENNEMDGMFPKMFAAAKDYCFEDNDQRRNVTHFVGFRHRSKNQTTFDNLFTNFNITYGTGNLTHVNKQNAMWGPITKFSQLNPHMLNKRHVNRYTFHRASAIAVIVSRGEISIYNKFFRGIWSCRPTITVTGLLTIIFGILIWLMERKDNENFDKSFLTGAMTGIWWSFITLTTVGYGDVVPKSPLGRILACVVMYTGMVIVCVITGTVTAVVSGTSDLGIYERRVAVVKDSYEERIAEEDYKADTVSVANYAEVLIKVRNGEVFAGLMNEEIAFAYQDNITVDDTSNPLRIIYTVPAVLDITLLASAHASHSIKYWKCIFIKKEEIFSSIEKQFQTKLKIQTLYYGAISDILDATFFKILLAVAATLVLMGILFEAKCFLMHRKDRTSQQMTETEAKTARDFSKIQTRK